MPNPTASDSTLRHESWAEVRAHDTVMRYRRSGAGRPVLLLASADNPLWPELHEAIGAGYRLIVPEPPAPGADVTAWLGGFLEGLGTTSVRILASDRFCTPVLELALLDTEGIRRVVIVADGPATGDQPRGFLRSAIGRTAIPMVVVRRAQPASDGVALITEFLAEETAVPA